MVKITNGQGRYIRCIQTSVHYGLQLCIPETTARATHYVYSQPLHEIKCQGKEDVIGNESHSENLCMQQTAQENLLKLNNRGEYM